MTHHCCQRVLYPVGVVWGGERDGRVSEGGGGMCVCIEGAVELRERYVWCGLR